MASTPEITVAIILVNWNGYAYTQACLASLEKVTEPAFQVILVIMAPKIQKASNSKQSSHRYTSSPIKTTWALLVEIM